MKRLRFGEGVLGGKGVCFVDVIDFSHYKKNCECYSASHLLHMMCIFFFFFRALCERSGGVFAVSKFIFRW